MIIKESGMSFGPYIEEDVFYIEKSKIYMEYLRKKMKIAEFILKRGKKLIVVEAKSSIPNHHTSVADFESFATDIIEKFNNSFYILVSVLLKKIPDKYEEVSHFISLEEVSEKQINFYLVIKNTNISDAEYLLPIQDKLEESLSFQKSVWKVAIKVLSEDTARKMQLVL